MRKQTSILILWSIASLFASCKNDDNSEASQKNQAPEDFKLLTVGNTSTKIDLLPELTWEAATDPEGDTVTYSVFLDTNSTPQNSIATELTGTYFTILENLNLNTTYYWQVKATDSNDNTTNSEVFSFSTRNLKATLLTANAGFSPRGAFTATVFKDKIWVIGGRGPEDLIITQHNDIWSSEDGENWTLALTRAPFSKRSFLKSIVFKDKLWVIGGFARGLGSKNDVWSSENGIDWDLEIEEANFPPLQNFELLSFKDRLWIIGGQNQFTLQNKVWSSANGINWVEEVVTTPFASRTTAGEVFNNKLWIVSGFQVTSPNFSDVWSSNNGIDWTLEIENAPFFPKSRHTVTVFSNHLWVIAGSNRNPDPLAADFLSNTVWDSTDGKNWSNTEDSMPFLERSGHQTVQFNNGILLLGGLSEEGFLNDAWFLN